MVTWVDVVGNVVIPGVVVILAVIGARTGWRTFTERKRVDDRGHWWDRARWAAERAQDPDEDVAVAGTQVLKVLLRSKLAGTEETELGNVLWEAITGFADDHHEAAPTDLAYDLFEE